MSIEDIFYDVVKRIIELDDVDISKLYIDGMVLCQEKVPVK